MTVTGGSMEASLDLPVSQDRAFELLASAEVIKWWVRPGVFDTRTWSGDVRTGGRWQATGIGQGRPYTLEGEFLVVDRPRELVHTWHLVGTPAAPSTVTYRLEPAGGGMRLRFRHGGFESAEAATPTAVGWETSFARLLDLVGGAPSES